VCLRGHPERYYSKSGNKKICKICHADAMRRIRHGLPPDIIPRFVLNVKELLRAQPNSRWIKVKAELAGLNYFTVRSWMGCATRKQIHPVYDKAKAFADSCGISFEKLWKEHKISHCTDRTEKVCRNISKIQKMKSGRRDG
jgi:hypothetical protein